jgi:hypothetical protein
MSVPKQHAAQVATLLRFLGRMGADVEVFDEAGEREHPLPDDVAVGKQLADRQPGT